MVRSDRTREVVPTGFRRTKLSPDVLTKYLRGGRSPSSRRLLERVKGTLKQHVYFEDSRLYTLVALWVIGTYLYSIFGHYGYLFLFSMLMRSGKTRVIEVLSHLAFEASAPLNAPTPASLRELASGGGTSLLDTLERWRDKNQESHSAAMDILDAGFRNGGVVTKMVTTKGTDWQREEYPVYAPYAMAAIGRNSLTDTACDRSFVIEMHRKPVAVKTVTYTWHRCEEQCGPVRDDLYRWALRHAQDVAAINEGLRLEAEVDALALNDRAADIWRPIFALAAALGIPERELEDLKTLAREMGGDPETLEDKHRLAVVKALRRMSKAGKVVGTTTELCEKLREDGIEGVNLHELLMEWEFTQKSVRLPIGPRRAWELSDVRLATLERELSDGHQDGTPLYPSQE